MLPQTRPPEVIRYTAMTFATLSLLGAIYICLSSIVHKRLRSGFAFRMILWMTVFDSILATATIAGPLGTIEEESSEMGFRGNERGETVLNFNLSPSRGPHADDLPLACQLQAAAIQFSITSNLLWTLCFAIHLFRISSIRVNPLRTHTRQSLACYLSLTMVLPMISTIYIFQADLVGISPDYWCWVKVQRSEDAITFIGISIGIIVFLLFVLFFVLKIHLKRSAIATDHYMSPHREAMPEHPNLHSVQRLMVNRSRISLLRTISGSLSAYLVAPFVAFVPAHFNFVYGAIIEFNQHVLSWYILSGILLGICHFGVFAFGISLVRYSWKTTNCCRSLQKEVNLEHGRVDGHSASKQSFAHRALSRSQAHYMELV